MNTAKRFLISGWVQGVAYRAATRHKAIALGLQGYAKNLPDGRVEVLAYGNELALETLGEWLWEGPPMARVNEVEVSEANWQGCGGFDIR